MQFQFFLYLLMIFPAASCFEISDGKLSQDLCIAVCIVIFGYIQLGFCFWNFSASIYNISVYPRGLKYFVLLLMKRL